MTSKRDRFSIMNEILEIINKNHNSIKITPLKRKSNLSTSSFNYHYEYLIKNKFIKEIYDEKENKYITLTDKGYLFIEKYKKMVGLFDELEL